MSVVDLVWERTLTHNGLDLETIPEFNELSWNEKIKVRKLVMLKYNWKCKS